MESVLLLSDGILPVENDLIMGGRIRRHHQVSHRQMHGGASALPKLMHNLKLFDQSVMVKKGGSIQKPNMAKKPIKFII
jgi:hypothetical protein